MEKKDFYDNDNDDFDDEDYEDEDIYEDEQPANFYYRFLTDQNETIINVFFKNPIINLSDREILNIKKYFIKYIKERNILKKIHLFDELIEGIKGFIENKFKKDYEIYEINNSEKAEKRIKTVYDLKDFFDFTNKLKNEFNINLFLDEIKLLFLFCGFSKNKLYPYLIKYFNIILNKNKSNIGFYEIENIITNKNENYFLKKEILNLKYNLQFNYVFNFYRNDYYKFKEMWNHVFKNKKKISVNSFRFLILITDIYYKLIAEKTKSDSIPILSQTDFNNLIKPKNEGEVRKFKILHLTNLIYPLKIAHNIILKQNGVKLPQ